MGLATALSFARQGAAVVIAARREEEGRAAVSRITEEGGEAMFVATDVADSRACENLVERTLERYGRLDCAFNNAGVSGRSIPAADFSEAVWDRTIAVNLSGVFLSMKYQIPAMLNNGGGVIVNNASVAGLNGATVPGCAYVASKHGVVGLTKAAAAEYADQGIRINVVCPAIIKTPMAEAAFADPVIRREGLRATRHRQGGGTRGGCLRGDVPLFRRRILPHRYLGARRRRVHALQELRERGKNPRP